MRTLEEIKALVFQERIKILAEDQLARDRAWAEFRKIHPKTLGRGEGPVDALAVIRETTKKKLRELAEQYGMDPFTGKPWPPEEGQPKA